ncbi:amino acid permease, partial [Klebsiella pneumoniae]|nr:amino acid permease [Klebsiella pneumoniae]
VFEAALVGIFAFFCEDLINTVFSVHIPWLILAFAMLMTTGVLSYFDISLTSRVLGLCLVLEILILTAVAVAVLIHGGGPQGFVPES